MLYYIHNGDYRFLCLTGKEKLREKREYRHEETKEMDKVPA